VKIGVEMVNVSVIGLAIFPNPSDGNVTIGFDLDRNYEHITLQIFDVLGKEMQIPSHHFNQLSAGHHEVNVSTIQNAGVYYVRLNLDASCVHSRFAITQ
jgi:DUF971 family protein